MSCVEAMRPRGHDTPTASLTVVSFLYPLTLYNNTHMTANHIKCFVMQVI